MPQQLQERFCKSLFVGASPTRGSSLRLPATAWPAISGLWCNSSISRCELDDPGANPGFLTNFSAAHVRRRSTTITHNPEAVWQTNHSIKKAPFFEITSKRRKGFPSETRVKRGLRVVHGDNSRPVRLKIEQPWECKSPHADHFGMSTGQADRASVLTSACLRASGASPRHSAMRA